MLVARIGAGWLRGCTVARAYTRARVRTRGVPSLSSTAVLYQHRQARRATRRVPGWYHATELGRLELGRMSHAIKTNVIFAAGGTVLSYRRTGIRKELIMFANEIIRQYAVLGPTAVLILAGLLVFLTASAFTAAK